MTSVASPDLGSRASTRSSLTTSCRRLSPTPVLRPGAGPSSRSAATGPGGDPRVVAGRRSRSRRPPQPRPSCPGVPLGSGSCHPRSRLTSGRSTCRTETSTQAVTAFTRGSSCQRLPRLRAHDCLGRLAHVEALRGDLRRASRLAGVLVPHPAQHRGAGRRARPAGEGLDRPGACRLRARRVGASTIAGRLVQPDQDPWLATSRAAGRSAAARSRRVQPDAATRLLVGASEVASPSGDSEWLVGPRDDRQGRGARWRPGNRNGRWQP